MAYNDIYSKDHGWDLYPEAQPEPRKVEAPVSYEKGVGSDGCGWVGYEHLLQSHNAALGVVKDVA